MRHLSADRLAALADETPTADERAHLAACAECAAERDAHGRLLDGAALERARAGAPLSDWGAISARLRAEGLVRTPDDAVAAPADATPVLPFIRTTAPAAPGASPARRHGRIVAWASRAAAAAVLLAVGVAGGRVSAGERVLGFSVARDSAATTDSGSQVASTTPIDTGSVTGAARTVGNVTTPVPALFANTAQARQAMAEAARTYQLAMQYLAANDSTLTTPDGDPTEAYRVRLAALDDAVAATRRGLSMVPADPLLNAQYISSVSAREATLRQLDDALPVNERLTRF